ncbi:hypothetical protein ACTMU2_01940 [Cupriavidus basilensis]
MEIERGAPGPWGWIDAMGRIDTAVSHGFTRWQASYAAWPTNSALVQYARWDGSPSGGSNKPRSRMRNWWIQSAAQAEAARYARRRFLEQDVARFRAF